MLQTQPLGVIILIKCFFTTAGESFVKPATGKLENGSPPLKGPTSPFLEHMSVHTLSTLLSI